MDLNATYVFVNVINSGSFTEASRVLGIPVSTVSDKVASLEKTLGVTLINRTTRKLKLTDIGTEYFKKSEAAIHLLQSAGEMATNSQHNPTGTLKIAGPADFASLEIAEAIAEYRKKFPDVKVETHFSNRFVDMIGEGYDIAIRGGHLNDSSLIAKRIGLDSMILIASTKYLQKAPPLKHPKDLATHQCIQFLSSEKQGADNGWELRTAEGKSTKAKPTFSMSSTSFAVIIDLVKLGEGIALVPKQLAKEGTYKNKLVQVLPDWATTNIPVHLVYPPQRFALPRLKK